MQKQGKFYCLANSKQYTKFKKNKELHFLTFSEHCGHKNFPKKSASFILWPLTSLKKTQKKPMYSD